MKKKLVKQEGLLKWNTVCNVKYIPDNVSDISVADSTDSTDSETANASSGPASGPANLCQCSGSTEGGLQTETKATPIEAVSDEQISVIDEIEEDRERDTDSLVESMFDCDAGDMPVTPSSLPENNSPRKKTFRNSAKLFSTDPLYVKMLEHQWYSKKIENLQRLQREASWDLSPVGN